MCVNTLIHQTEILPFFVCDQRHVASPTEWGNASAVTSTMSGSTVRMAADPTLSLDVCLTVKDDLSRGLGSSRLMARFICTALHKQISPLSRFYCDILGKQRESELGNSLDVNIRKLNQWMRRFYQNIPFTCSVRGLFTVGGLQFLQWVDIDCRGGKNGCWSSK